MVSSFVSQFLDWVVACPYVLLMMLLLGCGTILTWKFLTQTDKPILPSPRTSLVLMLLLTILVIRSHTLNNQLLELKNDLVNADWKIKQG